ncbi:hypothetical protein K490DRAFT_66731 [Saccharata proteae CBS 121410]|uniref:Uncharacterized protein n=1 Tax=Saccharata proteae CBS 121410 TaxID=1314787 RepID=A0A9P4LW01_9PEZI|nr:hypothetical protein K490DRAFT_66731 [Saccharata proteae CBS 121410]
MASLPAIAAHAHWAQQDELPGLCQTLLGLVLVTVLFYKPWNWVPSWQHGGPASKRFVVPRIHEWGSGHRKTNPKQQPGRISPPPLAPKPSKTFEGFGDNLKPTATIRLGPSSSQPTRPSLPGQTYAHNSPVNDSLAEEALSAFLFLMVVVYAFSWLEPELFEDLCACLMAVPHFCISSWKKWKKSSAKAATSARDETAAARDRHCQWVEGNAMLANSIIAYHDRQSSIEGLTSPELGYPVSEDDVLDQSDAPDMAINETWEYLGHHWGFNPQTVRPHGKSFFLSSSLATLLTLMLFFRTRACERVSSRPPWLWPWSCLSPGLSPLQPGILDRSPVHSILRQPNGFKPPKDGCWRFRLGGSHPGRQFSPVCMEGRDELRASHAYAGHAIFPS